MPSFKPKPIFVEAVRDAQSGDWIIDGRHRYSDADFREHFAPIGKDSRLAMLAKVEAGQLVAGDDDEPIIVEHPQATAEKAAAARLQAVGLIPKTPAPRFAPLSALRFVSSLMRGSKNADSANV